MYVSLSPLPQKQIFQVIGEALKYGKNSGEKKQEQTLKNEGKYKPGRKKIEKWNNLYS